MKMKRYSFLLPATLKPYFFNTSAKESHDICWIVIINRNERVEGIYQIDHCDLIIFFLCYMHIRNIAWKYNRWEIFLNHKKEEGFHIFMNKKLIPLKSYMPLCQALFTVLSFWIISFRGKRQNTFINRKATSLEASALSAGIFLTWIN